MCYDKATAATDGPQPGAMALYRALINSTSWGAETKGQGVYNNRSVRNGRSLSVHAEGRALDIKVPISSSTGDRLYKTMISFSDELGIQQILWDGHGWRCDRGEFNTSKGVTNLHRDHLHIEMKRHHAATLTPARVAQILGEKVPEPSTILEEGDRGIHVANFQSELNKFGARLKVDGHFGPVTRAAVEGFQRSYGLTVDGIVGPLTRAVMAERKPMAPVSSKVPKVVSRETPPSVFATAPAPSAVKLPPTQVQQPVRPDPVPNPALQTQRADAPTEAPQRPEIREPARPAPEKREPQPEYLTRSDVADMVDEIADKVLQAVSESLLQAKAEDYE